MSSLLKTLGVEFLDEWLPVIASVLHLLLIAFIAWLLMQAARRLIRLFLGTVSNHPDDERRRRIETLGRAFNHIAASVIALVAGMIMLDEIGISVQPLLATAGVAGLAIGFGAQSLIKDYFGGFFLLVEDQLRQGDLVEIAGKAGQVESITLRHVRLRDYEGNVHYVPNGIITTVTNRSRGHAFAVFDLSIAYEADIDSAFDVMRATARRMREDASLAPSIIGDLELSGVDRLADSSVVVRGRMKTRPAEQQAIRREYLRRIKLAFEQAGIGIPFPQLVVHQSTRTGAVE
jgi:small conductance mechanosensitive channel